MDYREKYLKYKSKYLALKEQLGGNFYDEKKKHIYESYIKQKLIEKGHTDENATNIIKELTPPFLYGVYKLTKKEIEVEKAYKIALLVGPGRIYDWGIVTFSKKQLDRIAKFLALTDEQLKNNESNIFFSARDYSDGKVDSMIKLIKMGFTLEDAYKLFKETDEKHTDKIIKLKNAGFSNSTLSIFGYKITSDKIVNNALLLLEKGFDHRSASRALLYHPSDDTMKKAFKLKENGFEPEDIKNIFGNPTSNEEINNGIKLKEAGFDSLHASAGFTFSKIDGKTYRLSFKQKVDAALKHFEKLKKEGKTDPASQTEAISVGYNIFENKK